MIVGVMGASTTGFESIVTSVVVVVVVVGDDSVTAECSGDFCCWSVDDDSTVTLAG